MAATTGIRRCTATGCWRGCCGCSRRCRKAPQIKKALNENLSAKNIAIEAAYFNRPDAKAFERTYGWAWTLKLAEELQLSTSPEAKAWAANLKPLADTLAARYLDFLPKQVYPIRTGLHPNTAFGLAFALDYANAVDDAKLKELLIARSNDYFGNDTDYPAKLEPGGSDFLSPALAEADLMRRVLPADQVRDVVPRVSAGARRRASRRTCWRSRSCRDRIRSATRSSRWPESEPRLVHASHCRGLAATMIRRAVARRSRSHACRRCAAARRDRPLRRRALAGVVRGLPADRAEVVVRCESAVLAPAAPQ